MKLARDGHRLQASGRARASQHSRGAVPARSVTWRDARLCVPIRSQDQRAQAPAALDRDLPQRCNDGPSDATSRRALLQASVFLVVAQPAFTLRALAAPEIKRVFVAGATGNTGRRVVQQLRAQGYLVTAGVRDVAKGKKILGSDDPGLTIVPADVTKGVSYLEKAIGDSDAVISAIGAALNAGAVDEKGAINLIDASKALGVKKFVMVSSLLTNAPAMGQAENPNYKFLNLFGQVLDRKLVSEKYLRSSGLNWTIVRPGGLSNDPPEQVGNLIVSGEDTLFGLDSDPGRAISRDTVAAVCIAALRQDTADNKLVEIVSNPAAPVLPEDKWFA